MAKRIIAKRSRKTISAPKACLYCTEKREPWFDDVATLSKFITERGKIMSRSRTGLCSLHQRRLTTAIKHARHLALMPFISRV